MKTIALWENFNFNNDYVILSDESEIIDEWLTELWGMWYTFEDEETGETKYIVFRQDVDEFIEFMEFMDIEVLRI